MDDKVSNIGAAAVFKGVDDRAVGEVAAIGVAKFESDHTGGVAAQETLTLGTKLAAHVTGEGALATCQRRLVETHIALPADQGKLDGIEHGRFARTVDTDEIGAALAVDSGVFEQVPVDQADFGEVFHG